jgi:hypothetical protein
VFGHSWAPLSEVSTVPLVLREAGSDRAGPVEGELPELIDLTPTYLEAHGAAAPDVCQGLSLLGDRSEKEAAYSYTNLTENEPTFVSYQDREWKYVRSEPPGRVPPVRTFLTEPLDAAIGLRRRLRNRRRLRGQGDSDYLFRMIDGTPDEDENVLERHPEVVNRIETTIDEWFAECERLRDGDWGVESGMDDETRSQLEQMGYL